MCCNGKKEPSMSRTTPHTMSSEKQYFLHIRWLCKGLGHGVVPTYSIQVRRGRLGELIVYCSLTSQISQQLQDASGHCTAELVTELHCISFLSSGSQGTSYFQVLVDYLTLLTMSTVSWTSLQRMRLSVCSKWENEPEGQTYQQCGLFLNMEQN